MNIFRTFVLSFMSAGLVACATGGSISKDISRFSGTYVCPSVKQGDSLDHGETTMTIQHALVNGVLIEVSEFTEKGVKKDPRDPYPKKVFVYDGQWRTRDFFSNGHVYQRRSKASLVNPRKMVWESETPDYIDRKGKMRKAQKSNGSGRVADNGDIFFTGSYYDGEVLCRKQ